MSESASSESKTEHPEPCDRRLYLPEFEAWGIDVKQDSEREYCFRKNPGEEFFHLLLPGEIFLRKGDEKFCLSCAFQMDLLTGDRLFWQNRSSSQPV